MTGADRLNPRHLFALRMLVAAVWLYNGLVLKLWLVDPGHLAVVEAVDPPLGLSARAFLGLVGAGETLLGLAVASGLLHRPLAVFQILLIVIMNVVGTLSGGVDDPWGLLVTNLPLVAVIALVGRYGPGHWASS